MLPWGLKFLWAPAVERYRLPAAGEQPQRHHRRHRWPGLHRRAVGGRRPRPGRALADAGLPDRGRLCRFDRRHRLRWFCGAEPGPRKITAGAMPPRSAAPIWARPSAPACFLFLVAMPGLDAGRLGDGRAGRAARPALPARSGAPAARGAREHVPSLASALAASTRSAVAWRRRQSMCMAQKTALDHARPVSDRCRTSACATVGLVNGVGSMIVGVAAALAGRRARQRCGARAGCSCWRWSCRPRSLLFFCGFRRWRQCPDRHC